jgi:MscS family membrane protein
VFRVFVLFLLLLVASPAQAQLIKLPAAPAKSAPVAADKPEEEATDSPRVSMRTFLDLVEARKYQQASIYLDIPRGSEKRAAELTSKLHVVLSEKLLVNPEALSPLAHGRAGDGLPAGIEDLGKIKDAKGHAVAIRLVRHEPKSSDDEPRWVFAQSTVMNIDGLYAALGDAWIRAHLPPPLLQEGPYSVYYWQWLALPILAVVCLALGRLLSWSSGKLAKRVLSGHTWSDRLLTGLKWPTTFGWALLLITITMPFVAFTLRAEDLIERVLKAIAWLTFFWALFRIVAVGGAEIAHGDWARTRPSARSLSSVGMSLARVVVAALALMVALTELGYPVTSVIAGLGVGGVALALAAQKTVENLFGSLSILADQPFAVGDAIRVDTIEGTVESIGLRSTRVRTADRTLVVFPNGKLADMRIESLAARERIRFFTKVQLSRAATPAHVQSVLFEIKDRLVKHASVTKEDVSVRLASLGEASWDIEVTAYIKTTDATEFARVREELLLTYIQVVETAGTKLAFPTREVVLPVS